jgi:glycosyltransferase involved in cell wall biosynthesis
VRIAVAHEWLTNWAGSERVAEQLVRTVGADELVVSVLDPAVAAEHLPGVPVRGLWPSRLPGAAQHWSRYALPMLAAWAGTTVRADALLVSSHFAAHAAALRFDGPSIVYYHTPARMVWRPDIELDRLPPAARALVRTAVLPPLRRWDRRVAAAPTVLLANSAAVAARVQNAYGRTARVLHPPVDVARWRTVERAEPKHLLWFGRLVAYKRPDLAVEAARRAGLPLVVVGDGPERARLEATAPAGVRFLGHAPEPVVRDALAHASALVFPGEEDFGIAPVEALAAGVPVVAYAAGGAPDYVADGRNGLLVRHQDADELAVAVKDAHGRMWDAAALRESAAPFTPEAFRSGLAAVLDETLGPAWRR